MEMEVANCAADTLEHLTNRQSSEFALMFFQFFLVERNGLCPRNERLLKAFTGASRKFWLPLRMLGGIIHINRTKCLSCNYDPRVDDEVVIALWNKDHDLIYQKGKIVFSVKEKKQNRLFEIFELM